MNDTADHDQHKNITASQRTETRYHGYVLVDCRKCGVPLSVDADATDARCPYCGAGTQLGSVAPLPPADGDVRRQVRRAVRAATKGDRGKKRMRRWLVMLGLVCAASVLSMQIVGSRDERRPSTWQGDTCLLTREGSRVAAIAGRFVTTGGVHFGVLDGETGEPIWKRNDGGGQFVCLSPYWFGIFDDHQLSLYGSAHGRPISSIALEGSTIVATAANSQCLSVQTDQQRPRHFTPSGASIDACGAPRMQPIDLRPGVRACTEGAHLTPVTSSGTFSLQSDQDRRLRAVGAPAGGETWIQDLDLSCTAGRIPVLAMRASPEIIGVVGSDPRGRLQLAGLQFEDGEEQYRLPIEQPAPLTSLQYDGRHFLIESRGRLSAYLATTGEPVWAIPSGDLLRHSP